jgi:hypothetical protein
MARMDKTKLYMGLFIVFLMITSTLGFIYGSGDSKKVGENKFTLTEYGWQFYLKSRDQYWYFDYLPNEINLNYDIELINDKVFIAIEDNSYFYELSNKFALLGVILERINFEEINCDGVKTLIFYEKSYDKIYKESNCIYFEGNINKLIDGLFYHILGVI